MYLCWFNNLTLPHRVSVENFLLSLLALRNLSAIYLLLIESMTDILNSDVVANKVALAHIGPMPQFSTNNRASSFLCLSVDTNIFLGVIPSIPWLISVSLAVDNVSLRCLVSGLISFIIASSILILLYSYFHSHTLPYSNILMVLHMDLISWMNLFFLDVTFPSHISPLTTACCHMDCPNSQSHDA